MEPRMAKVYVTSTNGTLVGEVDGTRHDELTECIRDLGLGFGETVEVDYDLDKDGNDVWGLVDAMCAMMVADNKDADE